jgi:hypothetical protein
MVDIYWSYIHAFLVVCEIQKKAIWLYDYDYKKYLNDTCYSDESKGRYKWVNNREFLFKWVD